MKIITSWPENLTKAQMYKLTMSPETGKMKDAVGTVLEIAAWALYTDGDGDQERDVLAILTPEGETYGTNSSTFQGDFADMADLFGAGGVDKIRVISGTSKAGRQYITCAYAGE